MFPTGYSPAVEEDIPLNLLYTDSVVAHRSLDCRAADHGFIEADQLQVSDFLQYRETRTKGTLVKQPQDGHVDLVDIIKIYKDAPEPSKMESCEVADLPDIVAGRASRVSGAKTAKHEDAGLYALIIFVPEGKLTATCIHNLTRTFSLTPQFWDYYGTASVINGTSTMMEGLPVETNDVTLHLCQPVSTVRPLQKTDKMSGKRRRYPRDSVINFDFNSPSFMIKWRKDTPREPSSEPSSVPEVLLFCQLSPKTNFGELRNAITEAYGHPATKATLQDDPFGLFGVVLSQWLSWSQELFYHLEQLVQGIEKDLGLEPGHNASSKRQAEEVNFSEMHRISKHITQYLDTLQVTNPLQNVIVRSHEQLWKARRLKPEESASFQKVEEALQYYQLAFVGVKSRVEGLQSRISNQINLGFNLIQQRDAELAQRTNKSMYSLSLVTVAFLPLTAVASVLAMPYFSVHDEDLTWVGSGFTLAWAISTSLLLAFVIWLFWFGSVYHESILRRVKGKATGIHDGAHAV